MSGVLVKVLERGLKLLKEIELCTLLCKFGHVGYNGDCFCGDVWMTQGWMDGCRKELENRAVQGSKLDVQ